MNSFDPIWTSFQWDSPTGTRAADNAAGRFRRQMARTFMGQPSRPRRQWHLVPMRASKVRAALIDYLPAGGELRCLPVTDKQVERMSIDYKPHTLTER